MNDLKIILNVFYSPIMRLKQIIQDDALTSKLFFPINGGSNLDDEWSLTFLQKDNVYDNISELNPLLNEMTAIYWFWKNYKPLPDYVGFNHYRRFFKKADILDYSYHDIIISKPIFSSNVVSLAQQYALYHVADDLNACISTLSQLVGFNYANSFKTYLETTGKNYAPCNMFIMKKSLFEEWCNFMFPVAFKLKDIICCTEQFKMRDNYQKRAVCFLVERLFNYWCYTKLNSGFNIKEVEIDAHLSFKPTGSNERGDYAQ